jgi:hypothetical protein
MDRKASKLADALKYAQNKSAGFRNALADMADKPWPYTDPRAFAQGMGTAPSEGAARYGAAALPFVGDAVGLAQDIGGYIQDPGSLTPGAGALSLLGMVPGIPRMPKPFGSAEREALQFWVSETGSLKQARRQLWETAKATKDPEIRRVAEYADEIEGILRFNKAEDADPVSLAKWLKSNPVGPDGKAAAKVLDTERKPPPRHPGGW